MGPEPTVYQKAALTTEPLTNPKKFRVGFGKPVHDTFWFVVGLVSKLAKVEG